MTEKELTIDSLKEIWASEFLPSIKNEIRAEIKSEIDRLQTEVKSLSDKFDKLESSQSSISKKYDDLLASLQETKRQLAQLQTTITSHGVEIQQLSDKNYVLGNELDEIQQYSRRDCIELVGLPRLKDEDPIKLLKEVCSAMKVQISDQDISTVHRLPDTKKVKNRMIAKLTRRDVKEQIYSNRKNLLSKTTKDIPSIAKELGNSLPPLANKIFINESLTSTRKKLFNEIYKYKKNNGFKYIWTTNGKVYLKENESSQAISFSTFDDFEYFTARE